MNRRSALKVLSAGAGTLLAGCAYWRIDPMHVLIRSEHITTLEQERELLARARLESTEDGRIRVLYVRGTPYECGYQHGALLRKEVQENLGTLYENALKKFHSPELFAEVYERLRPFIPQEYVDEMHGLAHGSRMPLEVIHHVHALPSLTEWGGKRRLKEIAKQMMSGDLGTSCSNIGFGAEASADGRMYAVRVLDWGLHRISKLHDYPLITVARPNGRVPFANIGWVGFLGAVSGMNAEGITLGEMGYGDPSNETLRGKPMIFLLRDVLEQSRNLADVRDILRESPGTNSFVFLMTDGKAAEAELYIKDRDRFVVSKAGTEVEDGERKLAAIPNISYGGHYDELMEDLLAQHRGALSPRLLMDEIIPQIAMKSNFQNVVYDPGALRFWVNNAAGPKHRAAEQVYSLFDLREALQSFPA